MTDNAALIAVDWGSTRLRAWLVAGDGRVLDQRALRRGITQLEGRTYAEVFDEAVGDWHQGGRLPALMAGMVGSRQGWIEAPYAPCPARLADLVGQVVPVPERANVFIVPGLAQQGEGRRPDVIRGEETQLFGLGEDVTGIAILPGTHAKWARLENGAVTSFATFLTGEVYELLTRHSIIGKVMTGLDREPSASPAFARGAEEALSEGHPGTLQSLFTVRARGILGEMAGDDLPGYLSGLLIGAENRERMSMLAREGATMTHAMLCGAPALTGIYARVLGQIGIGTTAFGEDRAVAGLLAIARTIGLTETVAA